MITFKQFISEEDVIHRNPKQAAEQFVKHCKQWKDVEVPLYRITDTEDNPMRTREPRTRKTASHAGTRAMQELIFAQEGWEQYPDRLNSIFCSTNKSFAVGDMRDDGENLLLIYPFDGVKIGMTTEEKDFNFLKPATGAVKGGGAMLIHFNSWIGDWLKEITKKHYWDVQAPEILAELKAIFLKDGKFDPTCNGNEKYAKQFQRLYDLDGDTEFQDTIKGIVTKMPENMTPKNLGVELVTSSTIDLPGKTRECWFSGKYLSIPNYRHKQFVAEVKALLGNS